MAPVGERGLVWDESNTIQRFRCTVTPVGGTATSFAVTCVIGVLSIKMQESQQLIVRAYEVARRTGKTDWTRMTTAVLKNRLLDLTDRSFDERSYGASSFLEFLSSHEDLVRVDRSVSPPIVELKETETIASSKDDETKLRYRIRRDLWQAAIDHLSGTRYVWDVITNTAIPSGDPNDTRIICTITADRKRKLRDEFRSLVSTRDELDETESKQLQRWIEEDLGVTRIPTRLRSKWIIFFRDKVRDHLLNWFQDSELQPPPDMISQVESRSKTDSPEVEELRKLVLSVVREMTQSELSTLCLPAQAVLRVARTFRS